MNIYLNRSRERIRAAGNVALRLLSDHVNIALNSTVGLAPRSRSLDEAKKIAVDLGRFMSNYMEVFEHDETFKSDVLQLTTNMERAIGQIDYLKKVGRSGPVIDLDSANN